MSVPNYARPDFSPVPKDPPHKLVKDKAKGKQKAIEDVERERCHVRSGGQCEVRELWHGAFVRCGRRATENHHLLGGIGRRNQGRSILAVHRLDVCKKCHQEITGKVLVPVDGVLKEFAAKVQYERVKL